MNLENLLIEETKKLRQKNPELVNYLEKVEKFLEHMEYPTIITHMDPLYVAWNMSLSVHDSFKNKISPRMAAILFFSTTMREIEWQKRHKENEMINSISDSKMVH